jgi:hypothetical protein
MKLTLELRRREFIQTMAGALASAVAGGLAIHAAGRPISLAEWFEARHQEWLRRPERQSEKAPIYVDEIDPNYRRFRQRLREALENGHHVVRWELHAPHDGFRFVRVYVKDGPPLTWNQPWEGEYL